MERTRTRFQAIDVEELSIEIGRVYVLQEHSTRGFHSERFLGAIIVSCEVEAGCGHVGIGYTTSFHEVPESFGILTVSREAASHTNNGNRSLRVRLQDGRAPIQFDAVGVLNMPISHSFGNAVGSPEGIFASIGEYIKHLAMIFAHEAPIGAFMARGNVW